MIVRCLANGVRLWLCVFAWSVVIIIIVFATMGSTMGLAGQGEWASVLRKGSEYGFITDSRGIVYQAAEEQNILRKCRSQSSSRARSVLQRTPQEQVNRVTYTLKRLPLSHRAQRIGGDLRGLAFQIFGYVRSLFYRVWAGCGVMVGLRSDQRFI